MKLFEVVPAPYRILLLILLVVSAYLYGWVSGSDHELTKQKIVDQAITVKVLEKKVQQAEITERVVTKYVDRIQVVKQKGETIIKQVPKYIYPTDDDNCSIPDSFGVLWNKANRGDDAETTGGTDEVPDQDESP